MPPPPTSTSANSTKHPTTTTSNAIIFTVVAASKGWRSSLVVAAVTSFMAGTLMDGVRGISGAESQKSSCVDLFAMAVQVPVRKSSFFYWAGLA